MFSADLADDLLDHFGMGLQQPHLKIAELVQIMRVIIEQTDDAPCFRIEARDDVQ